MSKNTVHPKYRPDIDGLRAIAVLSVALYHAFPENLSGGFLGVDIFFVISGFLISTILFQNIDCGSFSIFDFYSRRIRRIFPALALVLISVLIFGWFCLYHEELQQLGKHAAGSAGFIQNFILWQEAGYFDNESETKPLLHIWSLGIEEQFYFLWPLLLWGAGRLSKYFAGLYKRLFFFLVTFLVFQVSYNLSVNSVTADPIKTFYLPQYRFFELALGGMLSWWVLYQPKISITFSDAKENFWPRWLTEERLKNALSFVGLITLLILFFKYNKQTRFPGKNALFPIFATAFIIWAGPHSWLNRRLLSHKALVWFGLISYPLYLWHWPILSFGRIIYGETPTWEFRAIAIAVSIILAWLTVKLIEPPFRFGSTRIPLKLATLCLLVFAAGAGGNVIEKSKFVRDFDLNNPTLSSGHDGFDQGYMIDGCGIDERELQGKLMPICKHDKRNEPTVALIGDSKAGSLWTGLVRFSTEKTRLLVIGGNGKDGAPTPYAGQQIPLVIAGKNAILNNKNIDTVILTVATRSMFGLKSDKSISDLPESKNFNYAYQRLVSFIQPFIDSGRKVIITVDNPTLSYPEDCIRRVTGISLIDNWTNEKYSSNICSISYDEHLRLSSQYRAVLEKVESKYKKKVAIFDVLPYLCDTSSNQCSMALNGRILYSYGDHISDYAAGLIAKDLMPFVEQFALEGRKH